MEESRTKGERGAWRRAWQQAGADPGLLGASVGAASLAVFWLAKLAMLGVALWSGFFSQAQARHALGLLGVGVEDLLAAALLGAVAALLGWAIGRVSPRRAALLSWLAVLPLLFAVALLSVVGVGLYRLYQTPLTWGQFGLLSTVGDLWSSVRANLSVLNVLLLASLPTLSLALAPWLGLRMAALLERWAASGRRRLWALALFALMLLSYFVAPGHRVLGLELNPVVELARSGLRRQVEAGRRMELGEDPHFDLGRVFDPADRRVEDTATLATLDRRPAGPMNLLLFVGESWAASQQCFLGGPPESCPRLQALRPHSLVFDSYYTITPVSMKSLFSLTCSIHPIPIPQAVTYVHGNIDCRSISELLSERGYATSLFHGGHFHYSDKLRYLEHRRYDVLRDGDSLKTRKRYPQNGWGSDDRAVRDDFVAWLAAQKPNTPWHSLLLPITPHYPYQPIPGTAEPFGRADLRARYLNQMALQDKILGDIWDELGRRGEQERTLIVLVGDHGQAFDEHPGNRMHGSYIYEESVRVPLIFINPLLFHGETSARVGNHLDLVPTILDILGLPAEPRHEGQSLLRGYAPRRVHFFTRYAQDQLGLRDGRFKYIFDRNRQSSELYDLYDDPGERSNLAGARGDMVERYHQLCEDWESFYLELIPHYERYRGPAGPCRGQPVCFLDQLEPTFVHGAAKPRKTALGRELKLGGRAYGRGWGVEAPSILRFSVAGLGFRWLEGTVGHDDDIFAGQLGETVSGQVFVDEKLVYSTGKMKKGDAPQTFRVSVEGAHTVEFFGHDMDGIGYRDHIDWADLRLSRD